MFASILALALVGQTPPATETAPRPPATRPAARRMTQAERIKAKKSARVAAGIAREREEARAAAQQARENQALYERMLPYMLEDQRQQLDRMSAIERNRAVQQMANAVSQDAATYQWQVWKSR